MPGVPGLELDSVAMEARLPTPKLDILHELLAEWSMRLSCTLLQLQELAGYLQFVLQVVPLSRAFLHHVFRFMAAFRTDRSHRHVPRVLRCDLDWWQDVATTWNGIWLLMPSCTEVHIYTDASGAKGIGGTMGLQWFSSRLSRQLRSRDIQYKELYASPDAAVSGILQHLAILHKNLQTKACLGHGLYTSLLAHTGFGLVYVVS